jgi:hypothetical protein
MAIEWQLKDALSKNLLATEREKLGLALISVF